MASKPYADTRLAKYVDEMTTKLRPVKSQVQIAAEAGFKHPNVIAMLKSGAVKLPLDRVPSLAASLDCDPRLLFRLALEQSGDTKTAQAISEIFGTIVTANELTWLEAVRGMFHGPVPALSEEVLALVERGFSARKMDGSLAFDVQ
jgi:hypothetical protein